jgi:hypothetical protein
MITILGPGTAPAACAQSAAARTAALARGNRHLTA